MADYEIAVVTKVPDPEGPEAEGNQTAAIVYNLPPQFRMACMVQGRSTVFELGEILILDSKSGREIAARGRKPDKWDIKIEYCSSLDEAVELSMSTMAQA